MFSKNEWTSFFTLLIAGSLILSACAALTPKAAKKAVTQVVKETVVVESTTQIVEEKVTLTPERESVTFDGYSITDIPTLDPQMAEDAVSINYIENLFVHLTNYDLETTKIVPEAATEWDISDDGLIYTFKIRTDIPWIHHHPLTGETTQVVDDEGNPRFVTAHDFVYGIKRACDPNTGSYYSTVIAPQIKGCSNVLFAPDPDSIPKELWDAVGVSAPDDETLIIELEFAASYFLSMTPMWTLAAVPRWAIEEYGKGWIETGNIVTNGRFVLHEWVPNIRRQFLRNPLMPAGMVGDGNIERVVINMVPDHSAGYTLWLNNEVDASYIPNPELQTHLQQFPDETMQVPDLAVFYISFRMTKPPFDDARVRRAFSAAFDRETFVAQMGSGVPMIHFAPPGIFGAPPVDEVGIGFDPEFARQQLAEAGYPNCKDFPQVTLLGYSSQSALTWIEFAKAQWEEVLGCSADAIKIEQKPFPELLDLTAADAPDKKAPHMWTSGWGPDYADENNWVGDVLWCKHRHSRLKRECNEIDTLIVKARQALDPQTRIELYRQIEEKLFGQEGEVPILPVYLRVAYSAEHSWLDRIPALFGGGQWYNWTIDWATKQAAQSK
jgi:oligopeptide transport system substrate-binding protein